MMVCQSYVQLSFSFPYFDHETKFLQTPRKIVNHPKFCIIFTSFTTSLILFPWQTSSQEATCSICKVICLQMFHYWAQSGACILFFKKNTEMFAKRGFWCKCLAHNCNQVLQSLDGDRHMSSIHIHQMDVGKWNFKYCSLRYWAFNSQKSSKFIGNTR